MAVVRMAWEQDQAFGKVSDHFLVWSFVAAAVLSFFGKGRVRALMIGWSVSMWAVFQLNFVLQFD
jgi:hypothetical protein